MASRITNSDVVDAADTIARVDGQWVWSVNGSTTPMHEGWVRATRTALGAGFVTVQDGALEVTGRGEALRTQVSA